MQTKACTFIAAFLPLSSLMETCQEESNLCHCLDLHWSASLQETATTILHSALVPIPLPVVQNAAKLDAQSHSGARKLDIALAAKLVSQLSISILLFVSVLRAFISFNSFHFMHAHSCMCAG